MAWDFDFFAALQRMKAPHDYASDAPPTPTPTEPTAHQDPAPASSKQVGLPGLALIQRFEGCARAQGRPV